MTANHEHTPTTDLMRQWHVLADHSGNKSTEEYEAEFDRWLATVESAAEQRGAEHHLRLAASELNMHHLTEDLSDDALELGVRFINLIQDRADRIANKEGDIA